MPYAPILATLGYVLSPSGRDVLLIHRNRRPDDPHFGKFNGLGGKLEADEAGLECGSLSLRGTISWPGFGKHGEDWFGFVFLIPTWTGTLHMECAEGTLQWHPIDRLLELSLWEGDRHFLPLVFDAKIRQFHGVMPYAGGRPVRWSFTALDNP
jgi:8-oxo-dGTP diphosphatase